MLSPIPKPDFVVAHLPLPPLPYDAARPVQPEEDGTLEGDARLEFSAPQRRRGERALRLADPAEVRLRSVKRLQKQLRRSRPYRPSLAGSRASGYGEAAVDRFHVRWQGFAEAPGGASFEAGLFQSASRRCFPPARTLSATPVFFATPGRRRRVPIELPSFRRRSWRTSLTPLSAGRSASTRSRSCVARIAALVYKARVFSAGPGATLFRGSVIRA